MKVAIITDTHAGARNDSPAFAKFFQKFFDEVFWPEIDWRGIRRILHLGDLVDRRKYINYQTLANLRKQYIEPSIARDIQQDIIVGNHDCTYRNTNEINAIRELFGKYPIKIHIDPTEINIDNLKILLLPWICDGNREATARLVETTDASIVMGHLELLGFEVYRGLVATEGVDTKAFQRFKMVLSGHYHYKSSSGNIHYLGSPYDIIWSDAGDPRGFHIFDTETLELEFIKNPYSMHHKIFYDDAGKELSDVLKEFDFSLYTNTIVKVVIVNKTNAFWFDRFITQLELSNPAELQIVEDHFNADSVPDDNIIREADDTLTIFRNSIKAIEKDVDKDRLERLMVGLYEEAMRIE